MDSLEAASLNLQYETSYLDTIESPKLIKEYHGKDSTILKRETIHNYVAAMKSLIYTTTEYFGHTKKLLAWTHKSFDTGILLAGEIKLL